MAFVRTEEILHKSLGPELIIQISSSLWNTFFSLWYRLMDTNENIK